jgi:hypothetical protein
MIANDCHQVSTMLMFCMVLKKNHQMIVRKIPQILMFIKKPIPFTVIISPWPNRYERKGKKLNKTKITSHMGDPIHDVNAQLYIEKTCAAFFNSIGQSLPNTYICRAHCREWVPGYQTRLLDSAKQLCRAYYLREFETMFCKKSGLESRIHM